MEQENPTDGANNQDTPPMGRDGANNQDTPPIGIDGANNQDTPPMGSIQTSFNKSEHFQLLRDEHFLNLEKAWTKVEEQMDKSPAQNISHDINSLRRREKTLNSTYQEYMKLAGNYHEFLSRKGPKESKLELEYRSSLNVDREILVQAELMEIDNLIQQVLESMSARSSRSSKKSGKQSSSRCSNISSVLATKKAEAEAARTKVEFGLKENQLRKIAAENTRKQAELAADLELLNQRKEAAAAEAAVRILQSANSKSGGYDRTSDIHVPVSDPVARTKDYVLRHSDSSNRQDSMKDYNEEIEHAHLDGSSVATEPKVSGLNPYATPFVSPMNNFEVRSPNMPSFRVNPQQIEACTSVELTKFLLKKDLLLSRLTVFNDKPESYATWKASFQGVMQDLQVNSAEELDLLVKWLGQESGKHAVSIRASNAGNPERGRCRLWERLDERFGSAEMVEAALQEKLSNFPKLGNKDHKRLYELSDILAEIEAIKEDPKYHNLLAYYDSSSGVRPIVGKLPYNIQDKWTSEALRFKKSHNVPFPPFSFFAKFIREISSAKNDPSFFYDNSPTPQTKTRPPITKGMITTKKTEIVESKEPQREVTDSKEPLKGRNGKIDPGKFCPIHKSRHPLNECKGFKMKPIAERKEILKGFGICYRCCASNSHLANACTIVIQCAECGSEKHCSALHISAKEQSKWKPFQPHNVHGGEETPKTTDSLSTQVATKCTQICGEQFSGKSCAKTVLVRVYRKEDPSVALQLYAILDDQSNSSLANTEFFDQLNIKGNTSPYTLSSCTGSTHLTGRRATGYVVEAMDGTVSLDLPTLIECNQVPNIRDEIPTPEVAQHHSHLNVISTHIPPIDEKAEIMLLIGRDLPEAHHVLQQLIGPKNSPYAQRLPLGWVIVGETCLGNVHKPETVSVYKTNLLKNGRPSIFKLCPNEFKVKATRPPSTDQRLGASVFERTPDDDKIGLSIEDKEFLKIMDKEFTRNSDGKWVAPLPFRAERPRLPNNLPQALQRARILDKNLRKNPTKRAHFVTFMRGIFKNNHAEIAPPVQDGQERWYLPIFGVYHPQKPGQIRGVFDSSAEFQGISLNNVLLSGPDMTNNLLGILMRFRMEPVGIMADIQQMFYCFAVREDHRDFLRFIWYKDNDPEKPLIEYRMCVHVFGNSPSPAVATYGLRRAAELSEKDFGSDVRQFVEKNFYVDDGLTSLPTAQQAVDVMKRTQEALSTNGNIRLHKLASNSKDVMNFFPCEDLAKDFKNLDLATDSLPAQRTLGMVWNLETDTFTYKVSEKKNAFTKRGVLSTVNSLYDPIGFIAPITIQGKIYLRNMVNNCQDWDEPLSEEHVESWENWTESLLLLQDLHIPRTYAKTSMDNIVKTEIEVYSDASEQAIASVAYLSTTDKDGNQATGFLLGKSKVAPTHGHTIPRLELCAAVLAVEISDVISEQLAINPDVTRFYTDSKVVLGYIHNQSRRFHVYVGNRVDRIRKSSSPEQWNYIPTADNPADHGTRAVAASQLAGSTWLTGPLPRSEIKATETGAYPLVDPHFDTELRREVTSLATSTADGTTLGAERFQRFSSWRSLVKSISVLKHLASCNRTHGKCEGWHLCQEWKTIELYQAAELFILREVQKESFRDEISLIKNGTCLPKRSPLVTLNPYIDDDGLLRVGGRLNAAPELTTNEKNPIIIPKRHHVASLLTRHFHEQVKHQGRHFTEGAVRTAGYWLIGGKRLISSIIHKCVKCRKLRGRQQQQQMADLPPDRLQPSPPFSYVGVDTFGHWTVVSRRTRGGQAQSKRWAILFSCLTTRAVHIEVVEDMSSSSFINALRRFMAIRGKVKEFRSDRGSNFIGSTDDLQIDSIHVEENPMKEFLYNNGVVWKFNPPHSSHMGGAWERMIGITRRILDSILSDIAARNLTHEVLCTFMAEVCSVINARPIVPVSTDPDAPVNLSPSTLLTMKMDHVTEPQIDLELADLYKAQWRCVQALASSFWKRWRQEYIHILQHRRKWQGTLPNIKEGSIVLLKQKDAHRNEWPTGLVTRPIPGLDGKVRKAVVRVVRDGQPTEYTRPVTEMVLLCEK